MDTDGLNGGGSIGKTGGHRMDTEWTQNGHRMDTETHRWERWTQMDTDENDGHRMDTNENRRHLLPGICSNGGGADVCGEDGGGPTQADSTLVVVAVVVDVAAVVVVVVAVVGGRPELPCATDAGGSGADLHKKRKNTREQHCNNKREGEAWVRHAFVKRFVSQGGAVNETTATSEPSSSSPKTPSLLSSSLLS